MRGRHLLGLAAVAFVVAFLVPMYSFDWITFFGRIRGNIFFWQTWRIERWRDVPGAAISTILCSFFVATWLIAFFWPGRLRRGLTWAAWTVVAYLASWLVAGLRFGVGVAVGYYLMLASFVLLGLALHRTRRERLLAADAQSPVAPQ